MKRNSNFGQNCNTIVKISTCTQCILTASQQNHIAPFHDGSEEANKSIEMRTDFNVFFEF